MVLLVCLLLAAFAVQAQQISGTISGIVKDSQGAVMPGAKVTLIDQDRSANRKQDASGEGQFSFDLLAPSTYSVIVEAAGFKRWEKKDIVLHGSDRVGINDIMMEIGQLNETVTVEASTATLQTESAKVEGIITSQQVTELSSYNRNFMYMLRTIPGVTGVTDSQVNINGGRNDQTSFKLDGMSNMDYGNLSCCSTLPNLDMIAEMKVVTNGGTADMGSLGSSQIIIVTKGGSKDLHGNAYFFKRAEFMNSNSWTNNVNNIARGRDRMNQGGFTLSGPLFIPKLLNTHKEKLFFFVSEELWKNMNPSNSTIQVPTPLERVGDFTQSHRNDNSLVTVLDPLNARAPFAGNVIPQDRWNSDAAKLMNIMPLPNVTDASIFNYNYRKANTPAYSDVLSQSYRLDYNITDKWRTYVRYSHDYRESGDPLGMASFEYDPKGQSLGWNLTWRTSWNLVWNTTTIISPTSTNELVIGGSKNSDHHVLDNATYLRANLGMNFTLPNPSLVRGDYGPRISFGGSGLSNAPRLGNGGPYYAINPDYNIVDNFTKIFSRHTLKVGATYQLDRKDQDPWGGTNHPGAFQFSRDGTNPVDTDYQFANFLTGGFQTFNQPQTYIPGRYVFNQLEWYVADTWKVRSNLTVDLGVRFYVFQPAYEAKGRNATFVPALYNPATAPRLYQKALVGGKSVALDPATGKTFPSFMQGQLIPGSGNIDDGYSLVGQNGVPEHLIPYAGIQATPRIGIAWQLLPKTVLRFGGGVFKDRIQINPTMDSQNVPPVTRNVTLQFGYMSDVSSSLYSLLSPPSLSQNGYTGSGKIPTTYNWNLTFERELPYATVMSVGYVGSISRNLMYMNWVNEPNYGAAWLPQNQDPTSNGGVAKFDGTTTLPMNFYRPYMGSSDLRLYATGGTSNYNALQVQANKRMSRKLSYSVAYTYSKTMGVADQLWSYANPFGVRQYNYGRTNYDREHVMTASFIYYLPKFGKNGNLLDHPGIRLALNDWQLTGLVTAQTGTPADFGFGFSSGVSNQNLQWTGQGNWGPRPILASGLALPSNQMTEFSQFNVNAIQAPPMKSSVGLESGYRVWTNPGTFLSSPEITMMKNVMFSKDGKRYVQLRLETYNTLNHHDYTGRSMGATFNTPTDLTLTNLPIALVGSAAKNGGRFGFGALNGAASPRRVQISLKIYF